MIKILCCKHLQEKLREKEIPFKKSNTFDCDCSSHDGILVIKCSQHQVLKERFDDFPTYCCCNKLRPFEFCGNCHSRCYVLNYCVSKI